MYKICAHVPVCQTVTKLVLINFPFSQWYAKTSDGQVLNWHVLTPCLFSFLTKTTSFWDMAPFSLVEVYRRFRSAYYLLLKYYMTPYPILAATRNWNFLSHVRKSCAVVTQMWRNCDVSWSEQNNRKVAPSISKYFSLYQDRARNSSAVLVYKAHFTASHNSEGISYASMTKCTVAVKPHLHDASLLARVKVPGMRAQKFHASYGKFNSYNFEASCDLHYSTCMKRLRAHLRHLTPARQLASCKRGLSDIHYTENEWHSPSSNPDNSVVSRHVFRPFVQPNKGIQSNLSVPLQGPDLSNFAVLKRCMNSE
jgi:hypothetical protein